MHSLCQKPVLGDLWRFRRSDWLWLRLGLVESTDMDGVFVTLSASMCNYPETCESNSYNMSKSHTEETVITMKRPFTFKPLNYLQKTNRGRESKKIFQILIFLGKQYILVMWTDLKGCANQVKLQLHVLHQQHHTLLPSHMITI